MYVCPVPSSLSTIFAGVFGGRTDYSIPLTDTCLNGAYIQIVGVGSGEGTYRLKTDLVMYQHMFTLTRRLKINDSFNRPRFGWCKWYADNIPIDT